MKLFITLTLGLAVLIGAVHAVLPYDVKIEYGSTDSEMVVTTDAEDVIIDYDGFMNSFQTTANGNDVIEVPSPDDFSESLDEDINNYLLYSKNGASLLSGVSDDFVIKTENDIYSKDELYGVIIVDDFIADNIMEPKDVAIIVSSPDN